MEEAKQLLIADQDKRDKHFLIIVGLFQSELTVERVNQLKKNYDAKEIKVKPYDAFDGDDFYHLLLNDILYGMPHNVGLFNNNVKLVGELVKVFLIITSKMTIQMLNDAKIRLCFSLLPYCFYETNKEKAVSSFTNLINCAYDLNPEMYIDDIPQFLQIINNDFLKTIFQYLELILQRELNLLFACSFSDKTDYDKLHIKAKQLEAYDNARDNNKDINMSIFKQFIKEYKEYLNTYKILQFATYYLNNVMLCFALIRSYYDFIQLKQAVKYNSLTKMDSTDIYDTLISSLILDAKCMIYTQEILFIINNNETIVEFIQKLKSDAVKEYYLSKAEEVKEIEKDYEAIINSYKPEKIGELKQKINKTIIVMPLCKGIKAITTSFCRIAINSKWITVKYDKKDLTNSVKLFFAYVVEVLFQQSNNVIRRYCHIDKNEIEIQTPRKNDNRNGGEIMFVSLFDSSEIDYINLTQAQEINNISNWEKKTYLTSIMKKEDDETSFIKYSNNSFRSSCNWDIKYEKNQSNA